MMKVLLVEHPRKIIEERCNDIANAPLSASLITGYVAAFLEKIGHETKIAEGYMDKLSYSDILKIADSFLPGVIGIHLVYNWGDNDDVFELLKAIKAKRSNLTILVYGYYSTFAYEDILENCSTIDAVIIGEPENTFSKVVESLRLSEDYQSIPGLAFIKEGKVFKNGNPELIDELDMLPFPVRTEGSLKIGEVNIQGSKGCYGSCTFCYINPFYGGRSLWRGRSVENIIAEVDEVILQTGMKYFYFTDPNFFGPGRKGQERAIKLAQKLKERNLAFGIEARVDSIEDETIRILADAGLNSILIGLESGKDESLERFNKLTSVSQNEQAIQILRKYGIELNVGFIMFEPDSSPDDLRKNFDFLLRNELLSNLVITVNVLYHHQIILQGTKSYAELKKQGRLILSDKSKYEASTNYSDPQVAAAARIMRETTNEIFKYLNLIWTGKIKKTDRVDVSFNQLNSFLINMFESVLIMAETQYLSSEEINDTIIFDAIKDIKGILDFS